MVINHTFTSRFKATGFKWPSEGRCFLQQRCTAAFEVTKCKVYISFSDDVIQKLSKSWLIVFYKKKNALQSLCGCKAQSKIFYLLLSLRYSKFLIGDFFSFYLILKMILCTQENVVIHMCYLLVNKIYLVCTSYVMQENICYGHDKK